MCRFPFVCILSILFLISCQKENRILPSEGTILRLDEFRSIEGAELPPEYFVREVKYINLMSEDIELDFKGISKLLLYDNRFFILDTRMAKLLVYDMDGKAVAQIGQRGSGPEEYVGIIDFDIDQNGNIYLVDGNLDKLFVYDPSFRFREKIDLPFEVDLIRVLDNGDFLFGLSSWNADKYKGAKIVRTDGRLENGQVLREYDKYVDNSVWISPYTFVSNSKGILYNRPLDNDILQFSSSGELIGSVSFDFGRQEMPKEEKKDIQKYFHNLEKYNFLQCFTIVEDDFLLGSFLRHGQAQTFFIDLQTETIHYDKYLGSADIVGFYHRTVIAQLIPGTDRAANESLPEEVRRHLEDENFVLCLYVLK